MDTTTTTTKEPAMTEFHIWENGIDCGTWTAPDAVTALALAIAGADWSDADTTIDTLLTASDLDDEPRTATASVQIGTNGRPIRVVIEADS
jgi:hypothetical protein